MIIDEEILLLYIRKRPVMSQAFFSTFIRTIVYKIGNT